LQLGLGQTLPASIIIFGLLLASDALPAAGLLAAGAGSRVLSGMQAHRRA
jgi:hypothetical protein